MCPWSVGWALVSRLLQQFYILGGIHSFLQENK